MSLQIKKILVPTDFSEFSLSALNYAGYIAKKTNAEIILLHVVESYSQNANLSSIVDVNEVLEKAIDQKMLSLKDKYTELWGVKVQVQIENGKIHQVIEQLTKQEGIDLVVMGTHGSTGITNFSKFILGSNAYRTVQQVNCPVLTIRGNQQQVALKKILLPLDFTKETRQKVKLAIAIAKLFDAAIYVVSVSTFLEEFREDIEDMRRQMREVVKSIEEEKIECHSHMLRHDDVSDSVIGYSRQIGADLVIIMTRQESRWNRFGVGSRARGIISESEIPVLSIQPKA